MAIDKWLKTNNTSPQTGLTINKQTYPCITLQNQLEEFYNNNPLSKSKRFQQSQAHVDNVDEICNVIINAEYTKLLITIHQIWNVKIMINGDQFIMYADFDQLMQLNCLLAK